MLSKYVNQETIVSLTGKRNSAVVSPAKNSGRRISKIAPRPIRGGGGKQYLTKYLGRKSKTDES
jgi:hypothetical protein